MRHTWWRAGGACLVTLSLLAASCAGDSGELAELKDQVAALEEKLDQATTVAPTTSATATSTTSAPATTTTTTTTTTTQAPATVPLDVQSLVEKVATRGDRPALGRALVPASWDVYDYTRSEGSGSMAWWLNPSDQEEMVYTSQGVSKGVWFEADGIEGSITPNAPEGSLIEEISPTVFTYQHLDGDTVRSGVWRATLPVKGEEVCCFYHAWIVLRGLNQDVVAAFIEHQLSQVETLTATATTTTQAPATTTTTTTTQVPVTTTVTPSASAGSCGAVGTVVGVYPVGDGPQDLAFDGSHVWVTTQRDRTVSKLRASDGEVIGVYPVGEWPQGLVFDGSHIWVTDFPTGTVSKLRASDGEIIGTYPLTGGLTWGLTFDGTYIWITTMDGMVSKLRASDGELVGSYPTGGGSSLKGLLFDGTYIWVAGYTRVWPTGAKDGVVSKLRASDGELVGSYPVGDRPEDLAFDGTYIWVTDSKHHTLSALRPSDGKIMGTYGTGLATGGLNEGSNAYNHVVFDGTRIWVTDADSDTVLWWGGEHLLWKVNENLRGLYNVGNRPQDLMFDGTHIWVAHFQDDTVWKLCG